MKQILSLFAITFLFAGAAHAQEKACPNVELNCKFYKNNQKAEKTFVESDKKSLAWAWAVGECATELYSDVNHDDTLRVRLSGKTGQVSFDIVDRFDGPMVRRDGGANFVPQKNTLIYFQYTDHLAICQVTEK